MEQTFNTALQSGSQDQRATFGVTEGNSINWKEGQLEACSFASMD